MPRLDKLGVVVAAILAYGALAAPFAIYRASRIAPGEGRGLIEALPAWDAALLATALLVTGLLALLRTPALLRLAAATAALVALMVLIGISALHMTPPEARFARVSPGSGFWLMLFALGLLTVDALSRLSPSPLIRIAALAAVAASLWLLLALGAWDGLSVLKEYAARADSFWAEAGRHLTLALGSLAAAVIAGIPLGVLCHRVSALRDGVLGVLNAIQTIPSIALFGILIAPLGWIAAHLPGAAAIGIRGIGMAPAILALFLYSLLPVVANTVVGLAGIPAEANEAARGVGMTERQRLFQVEFPLALPVILSGIRIVLVQNIGMATIAALIGGGGFGVFVFQGIGQNAMDLVLLGAVPTVALAFAAAIILDAIIELSEPARRRSR
jgi:osmoprotectant transport system permease protein